MQKSKQGTLFRSWGGGKKPLTDGNARYGGKGKAPARSSVKKPPCQPDNVDAPSSSSGPASNNAAFVDLTEGEDFGFKDVEELDRFFEDDLFEEIGRERAPTHREPPASPHNSSILEDVAGFDSEAGEQWIYPINYPLRDYQFNIVQKCLFKNTLVCLPTGLGKTFIAAVVMFNFYHWYPAGKVVFMAPTKPLVTQQIEACHNIMGIPQTHLAEMTGNMPPKERVAQWISKRVFFLTPQVIQNDITKGACPADLVRCVVFDEAHKALGNYSYCQVVKELSGRGVVFRVLALSATPGNDLKAVQQVVSNLQLSHIELRADDSFDIQPYTHQRKVELHIVPLKGEILLVKNAFLEVLSGVIGRLAKFGVVYSSNPERLSKFGLLQARDGFRQCPPHGVNPGSIESDFATAISLFHAYDLLLLHGLRLFHHYLSHTFSNGSYPRAQQEVDRHPEMARHLRELRRKLTASSVAGCSGVGRSPRSSHYTSPSQCTAPDVFYGHPKLRKLEEVVLEHFRGCSSDGVAQSSDETGKRCPNIETRVMIFSQYRESVQEIADLLSSHAPLVRVMSFVGHGTTGKSTSKGLTQREQTEVVRKFREGGYNTLVATCVGEEGLDIGEVDLIVCFDAHKSPIRLVQRMGRTGRKRSGRIVVIVAQGKEEQTYRKSQSNKNSIHKAIRQNSRSLHFFPHAPRMVPRHIAPVCLKQCMTVEVYKAAERGARGRGRGKQQPRLSLGPPPLSRANQKGCLSHEELEEWSLKFSLPDRELRACEKAVGECFRHQPLLGLSHLKREKQSGVMDTPIGNRADRNRNNSTLCTPLSASLVQKYSLSLSKWVRWQTGQTHFKTVGPSETRKQFVSLLEFLDLMYSCDGLGESYSAEMAAFLDQEDIHSEETVGKVEERGKGGRRVRRRRLASDSSDDEDFVGDGVKRNEPTQQSSRHVTPNKDVDDPTSKHTPNKEDFVADKTSPLSSDQQNHNHLPSFNDRGLPTASQHAIPQPPCDSLDWLDAIEPPQVSTPLPSSSSSSSSRPRSPPSTSRDFHFAFPHTPPSSRKSKTPFVSPLTTPPHKKPLPTNQQLSTNRQPMSDADPAWTDQPSEVHVESMDLFDDISSAVLFDDFSEVDTSHTAAAQGKRENASPEREAEERKEAGKEENQDTDLNITSVPESEDEEENCKNVDEACEVHSDCEVSEESLIGGRGHQQRRRRKFARPDFLLTQAPPKIPPIISPQAAAVTEDFSDDEEEDDFLLEPLSRRLRKRGVLVRREEEFGVVARKKVCLEPEEYLDKEAELSGEGSEGEEEEREADEYDAEDSFINDNSVLTQVTPSQMAKETLRSDRGPINMADVYRQSLISPHDHLFGRRGRGDGYRMVLSQRHRILNHCLAKAGGRRLFNGAETGRREGVSGESGESEAEEVRVCYGEEDNEEIGDSQSIGEPWDWGEEEEEETRTDLGIEEEIVSPSLLVSVEPQLTPSCYILEVEGWLNETDDSCCSNEDPTTDD